MTGALPAAPLRVVVRTFPEAGLVVWPAGWPLPSVGHGVNLGEDGMYLVQQVDWYPEGEDPDDPIPFVCLVLRDRPT